MTPPLTRFPESFAYIAMGIVACLIWGFILFGMVPKLFSRVQQDEESEDEEE